ncbi:MAG: LytTR family DNA-binding domain-containing protein [Roseburia sp.]|nr:LytTR family DNA-binding domain-containing protein [Roseburia sp.]MCM1278415.1 LytTR family DNA-binding domain-containing protein [Robinsoniella sp.]
MLHIAICDDEPYYLERIEKLLHEQLLQQGISIFKLDTYSSGEAFLADSEAASRYQVIFLDINMPDINGLRVAEKIREQSPDVLLVFITAFIDYALEGYKMEAIRYLVKDMLEEMLPECVEVIIRKLCLQAQYMKYHFIEGKKALPVDRIYYIESQKHKLIFNVCAGKQKQYSLYDKLDNIEKELLEYGFLRIHKSYLVNTMYIEDICNYKVKMQDGRLLPVPRAKFQKVKEHFYEIKGDLV